MRQFTRTRLRRTIVAVPLIAAMLAMTGSITGCASLFRPGPALSTAAAPPKRVPTGAEKFATASDALTGSLDAAAKALKSGKRDARALAGIADFAKQLPALDKGVQADFAKTRGILKKIKSADKDAIQAKVEKQYAERQKTLASKLKKITSAETTAALKTAVADTSKWLDDITPEKPYQPLGAELPHRIVNANAGPPVLGTSIAPAYAPHLKGAEPSTLPVTPTPEDTTQTIEVQFTPEIESLVTSLGADPVRMYEYVRNTIDFEPYYGSRKGGTETLLEGSGNDIDTASLLIALYRKAGIPARYVSGVVDVPIAKAMNWVGVETPEAAAKLFASGGTPTTSLMSGGKVKMLRIEHTWAEAYVAYEDYRGAGAGTGPKRWVPLDASWKSYRNVNIRELIGPMVAAPAEPCTDTQLLGAQAALAREKVSSWLETHTAEAQSVVHPRRIVASRLGLLPQALGFRAVPVAERRAQTARDHVTMQVGRGDWSSYDMTLADAASSTITLSFEPADEQTVALLQACDGVSSVPSYLASLVPLLCLDGRAVAKGDPVHMGDSVAVEVNLFGSDGSFADAGRDVVAGGKYGIVVDAGSVPSSRLSDVRNGLQAVSSRALTEDVECAEFLGPLLRATGLVYFGQSDQMSRRLADIAGVVQVHASGVLFAAVDLTPTRILGMPISGALSGLSLDVRANNYLVANKSSEDNRLKYNAVAGYVSSMLEHEVFAQLFQVSAVSTARVFNEALRRGIPILTVTPENMENQLEQLEASAVFKEGIRSYVRRGLVVTTPRSPVPVNSWNGHAWLVVDPSTGDSGYMIDSSAGSFIDQLLSWVTQAVGPLADMTAVSWVWAPNYMKQYTEKALGLTVTEMSVGPKPWLQELCTGIALKVMPLLATYQQAVDDIQREDLSVDDRLIRLGLTFATFEASALLVMGVTMVTAGAFASVFGGAYAGAIVMGLCAAFFGVLVQTAWDIWKEQVFGLAGAP